MIRKLSSTYIIQKDNFTLIEILVYAIINQNCLKTIRGNSLMKFVIPLTGSLFKVIDILICTP